jgi:TfoX/Sxy family transcriptional regulator of competence genes
MAYNEVLAQKVRSEIGKVSGLTEKKMFGGIAYMVNGNMACGVNGENLIVRVGPEKHAEAEKRPHTRSFDMTGRPMKGWIAVDAKGREKEQDLKSWIGMGINYAQSLPKK